MKKLLNIAFISALAMSSLCVSGQKIKENVIDDFTGSARTSTGLIWFSDVGRFNVYCRFVRIDSVYMLNFKLSLNGTVFSVDKDAALLLKLESDTIIKLRNREYTVTTRGGGANGLLGSASQGANLYFIIPGECLSPLVNIKVKKVRIYTTDGFIDQEIDYRHAETFIETLRLLIFTPPPEKKNDAKF
ncbi:MAG: hypothetical protein M0Q38_00910 [Bacteroidales bacterium]|jgi:hypothetical protein|nr:hypothetical protein [Bacteroidales bacterium]